MESSSKKPPRPNHSLRYQREKRSWTLQDVADRIYELCKEENARCGINAEMVGKWELGKTGISTKYQAKLCILYETSADNLGFVDKQAVSEEPVPSEILQPQTSTMLSIPSNPLAELQTLHTLFDSETDTSETLVAHLLSLSSRQLATLTAVGWTSEDVIAAVHILMPGESIMAKMNRRQVLKLGAGMFLGSIALPAHEHPTAEDRTELSNAIGESIAASWTLFQNTNTAQVLAVGQAQLSLLQQSHHTLYPSVRPMHYSGVYRLIGGALHFQGRYNEARIAHEKSYIAALEGGDVWNMAQSLSWQANGFKEQREYASALETIDGALRLLSHQSSLETMRLQAHLLATSAENAAYRGDSEMVQARLAASEALLKDLPAHEEFDRISWYELAGACALILEQYDDAITHLEKAINELPPQWTLRHATTLMPLALAYARKQERDASLTIAEKAIPVIQAINSPSMNKQFVGYIQQELLGAFPADSHIQEFVASTQQKLLPAIIK